MNALDHVSAHLKLKDNRGRERHPGGVQFRERDRLITALSQPIQQPLLLDIKDIHRDPIVALPDRWRGRPVRSPGRPGRGYWSAVAIALPVCAYHPAAPRAIWGTAPPSIVGRSPDARRRDPRRLALSRRAIIRARSNAYCVSPRPVREVLVRNL